MTISWGTWTYWNFGIQFRYHDICVSATDPTPMTGWTLGICLGVVNIGLRRLRPHGGN